MSATVYVPATGGRDEAGHVPDGGAQHRRPARCRRLPRTASPARPTLDGVAASGRGAEPGPSSAPPPDRRCGRVTSRCTAGRRSRVPRPAGRGRPSSSCRRTADRRRRGGRRTSPSRPVDVGLGGVAPATRRAEVGVADQEQVTLDDALEHRGERTAGVRGDGLGGGEGPPAGVRRSGRLRAAPPMTARRQRVDDRCTLPIPSGRSCPDPAPDGRPGQLTAVVAPQSVSMKRWSSS